MPSISQPIGGLRSLTFAGGLLSFTLIIALLYFGKSIVIPIALALMLTFVLNPIVMLLQRWKFGRVPAVIATIVFAGLSISGLIWMVGLQLNAFVHDLPKYENNVRSRIASLREAEQESELNQVRAKLQDIVREGDDADAKNNNKRPADLPAAARIEEDGGVFARIIGPLQALSPAFEALGKFLLALILAIFMLIKREDLRNRLVSFISHGSLTTTTKALDDAGQRISRYMSRQLIVNGAFGLVVSLGLFLIGVPYALLCGLCAGFLRYIPYVGPVIATVIALSISFVTSSDWTGMLLIMGLFLVLELITANFLEPWLYGQGTGVSQVALLVCAAFWAWLWGPVGLVLSTPLTVCLVVAGKYVPSLAFFDKLLGDRPVLKPYAVYLQRLLARDPLEATGVVRDYRRQNAPERAYDGLFVPALILARHDRASGAMMPADGDYIVRETEVLIKELIEPEEHDQDNPQMREEGEASIVALPAHDEAEELTLRMLDQLMMPSGPHLDVCSTRTLPTDMISRVGSQMPKLVVIAALPPGGIPQACFLCERLRERWPQLGIIVGYWGCDSNLDEVIGTLRTAGANYVTTTLLGARSHILSMLDKPLPPNGRLLIQDQENGDAQSFIGRR